MWEGVRKGATAGVRDGEKLEGGRWGGNKESSGGSEREE